MDFFLRSVILVISGILVLRVAGRKSISQMTIVQTVIMISIGNLIVQPIANESVWRAVAAAAVFVSATILIEYLQIQFDGVEKFFTGKSKAVIVDGQLVPETMKKIRLTVDQLEMRLRQAGIKNISDVKTATIEPNGQLGYELIEDAEPLTVGQFKMLIQELNLVLQKDMGNQGTMKNQENNIFSEVKNNQHSSQIPKELH
ncbi:MAG: YetF domain-containing protein [Thermotaleaceae bacterium]